MGRGTVLVRAPNHLGDLLMSLPAQHLLASSLPEGGCTLGVLAPHFPLLSRLSPLPVCSLPPDSTGRVRLFRSLEARAALVLAPSFRGALEVFFARIPVRVGVRWDLRENRLTHRRQIHHPRLPFDVHISDLYVELSQLLLESLGYFPPETAPSPSTPRRSPRPTSTPVVVVHPGSLGSPQTRRWPLVHFRQVVEGLLQRGCRVQVVGGREEGPLGKQLALGLESEVEVLAGASALDLVALLALMEEAHVFVGNDSGPAHLAAVVGLPSVVIYTSTSPHLTGPRGPGLRMWRELTCSACYAPTCSVGLLCHDLSVDEVLARLDELLWPELSP